MPGSPTGRAKQRLCSPARAPLGMATLQAVGDLENAHAAMNLAHSALVEVEAGSVTLGADNASRHDAARPGGASSRWKWGQGTGRALAPREGFYRATGLEQHFRDLQAARFHPLQDQQQQLYAGQFVLGADIDG